MLQFVFPRKQNQIGTRQCGLSLAPFFYFILSYFSLIFLNPNVSITAEPFCLLLFYFFYSIFLFVCFLFSPRMSVDEEASNASVVRGLGRPFRSLLNRLGWDSFLKNFLWLLARTVARRWGLVPRFKSARRCSQWRSRKVGRWVGFKGLWKAAVVLFDAKSDYIDTQPRRRWTLWNAIEGKTVGLPGLKDGFLFRMTALPDWV